MELIKNLSDTKKLWKKDGKYIITSSAKMTAEEYKASALDMLSDIDDRFIEQVQKLIESEGLQITRDEAISMIKGIGGEVLDNNPPHDVTETIAYESNERGESLMYRGLLSFIPECEKHEEAAAQGFENLFEDVRVRRPGVIASKQYLN